MAPDEERKIPDAAPLARRLARAVRRPIERFFRIEGAGGIALIGGIAAALGWANSRALPSYTAFWEGAVPIGGIALTPRFVVNDVLMTAFFLLAGLELRRELASGVLSQRRRAVLPVIAALGGMVVPALIYLAISPGTPAGWGIPVATDIAFALGVLALVGHRLPVSLRVFVLALAILDDLGGILVVAVFYSRGIAPDGLVLAVLGIAALAWARRRRAVPPIAYAAAAIAIWCGLAHARINPAVAGAIAGLLTPARDEDGEPAARIEEAIHPWVAFGVIPLFALANAGIELRALHIDDPRLVLGIVAGLAIGKPLGIAAAIAVAVRLGIAELPADLDRRGVLLVGTVAGIGFTMSLFIADLAFADDPALLAQARLGLLAGSGIAAAATIACARLVRRGRAG